MGEKTSRKGLVQVYYNKTWGWVCADQWNKQNADVACRMMGFNGSLSTGFEIQNSKEASITSWMNNLQCTGKESSLLSCVHDKQRSRECANGKIAWTTCKERKGEKSSNKSLPNGFTAMIRFSLRCSSLALFRPVFFFYP